MFPDLHYIALEHQELVAAHSLEDSLKQWNVQSGNHDREALPVQYVCEWEIIVIGDYHRDTAIIQ